jgi:2'-5' RNA ligase
MIRMFVAVNLDPAIREKIGEAGHDFDVKGVRPVDPALVHVTLKFLGGVEETRLDEVIAALGRVHAEPFTARFRSIGGFPGDRNPRVIWIGAEGDFATLYQQVEDVMADIGFPREGRFTPHVTIGRVKFPSPEQKQKLPPLFEKYKNFDAGSMPVDHISLMKSTLSPKGPKYDVLKEIRL